MKRSYMKRGKRLNPRGKKVKAWERVRSQLKRRFAAAGILTCELRYAGCFFDDLLGFAHAKKRRKLTPEELWIVILACNHCHQQIEVLAPEIMEQIVMATIKARKVQP